MVEHDSLIAITTELDRKMSSPPTEEERTDKTYDAIISTEARFQTFEKAIAAKNELIGVLQKAQPFELENVDMLIGVMPNGSPTALRAMQSAAWTFPTIGSTGETRTITGLGVETQSRSAGNEAITFTNKGIVTYRVDRGYQGYLFSGSYTPSVGDVSLFPDIPLSDERAKNIVIKGIETHLSSLIMEYALNAPDKLQQLVVRMSQIRDDIKSVPKETLRPVVQAKTEQQPHPPHEATPMLLPYPNLHIDALATQRVPEANVESVSNEVKAIINTTARLLQQKHKDSPGPAILERAVVNPAFISLLSEITGHIQGLQSQLLKDRTTVIAVSSEPNNKRGDRLKQQILGITKSIYMERNDLTVFNYNTFRDEQKMEWSKYVHSSDLISELLISLIFIDRLQQENTTSELLFYVQPHNSPVRDHLVAASDSALLLGQDKYQTTGSWNAADHEAYQQARATHYQTFGPLLKELHISTLGQLSDATTQASGSGGGGGGGEGFLSRIKFHY